MTCKLMASGNIRLPRVRLYYPHFFKPQPNRKEPNNPDKARYQTTVLIPRGVNMKVLTDAVEAAAVEEWGADYAKKVKVKKPFLKTEDQPRMSELAADYPVFLRLNSRNKPGVVFANGDVCGDDKAHEVYGGRWAFVTVRAKPYDGEQKGVGVYLQNVQLLEDDERIGGGMITAAQEFEPVDVNEEIFS
jgi:hypothetical protein